MNTAKRIEPRLLVVSVVLGVCHGIGTASAQPVPCNLTFTSPLVVPTIGTPGDVIVDDACRYVYLSNTSQNTVEVFSLQTLTRQTPIQVGSRPIGIDITPDGTRMYVANSGGENISLIDLTRRTELRRISLPSGFAGDTPYSIAIASSGLALFSTAFQEAVSIPMVQLNLNRPSRLAPISGSRERGRRTQRERSGVGHRRRGRHFVGARVQCASYGHVQFRKGSEHLHLAVSVGLTGSTFLVTPGARSGCLIGLSGTGDLLGLDGRERGQSAARSATERCRHGLMSGSGALYQNGELSLGSSVDQALTFRKSVVWTSAEIADSSRSSDHGFSLVRTGVAPPVDTTAPTLRFRPTSLCEAAQPARSSHSSSPRQTTPIPIRR